jgi:hypothetical protein
MSRNQVIQALAGDDHEQSKRFLKWMLDIVNAGKVLSKEKDKNRRRKYYYSKILAKNFQRKFGQAERKHYNEFALGECDRRRRYLEAQSYILKEHSLFVQQLSRQFLKEKFIDPDNVVIVTSYCLRPETWQHFTAMMTT